MEDRNRWWQSHSKQEAEMSEAEKTAYQEKMEAKLTKIKADIQHMEGELKARKADVRIGMQEELQRLRQRSEGVKAKLHGLKTASGAAWTQAKDGVARAWSALESAFQKAGAEFTHQGRPGRS
jgi:predicted  nucleic acid-binding Zn-ribbon protein